MGLRGPGAKSIRRATDTSVDSCPPETHAWEDTALPLAERVIRFCESLPVTSGRFEGTLWRARPWQRRFIERLYRTNSAGRRLSRTGILSVARKNGKSDLSVRLLLAHFVGPCSEPRGELFVAGNDRAQAARLFSEMIAIIERVPWLSERISIRRHSKEAEDFVSGSYFAALSSDTATKHGLSPSFWIYDEFGQATSRELFDILDTAMGARDQPLGLVISTQAARDDMPMSELIDDALRAADDSIVLELHTAPPELDPFSEEAWRAANPAFGDIRDADDLQRLAAQAKRMPSRQASFENLVLNRRVDTVQSFISAAVWQACNGAVDIEALAGRECFGGLDLSSSRDMTSLCLAFPNEDEIAILSFNWLPGDLHDRENEDRAPYVLWQKQQWIEPSTGATIDPRVVAAKIAELSSLYTIRAIACDRWKIDTLRRALEDVECDVQLVEHGMGFRDMTGAVDALERTCFEKRLRHGGNPVLTYAVSNVRIESDPANNRKPTKRRSYGRIDPAVAAMLAVHAIEIAPTLPLPSVYESRGILAVGSMAVN